MKKYIIKRDNQYVSTIYQGSISSSSSINNALEFNSLEQAKAVRDYVKSREENFTYAVIEVETKLTAITE